MNYLTYVERCAENLQFMLWYRDYIKRFEALSANQQALSPKYTPPTLMPQHSPALTRPPGVSKASENFVNKEFEKHSASIRDTAAERSTTDVASPFITPPRTPYDGVVSPFFKTASVPKSLMNIDYRQATSDAFEKVDVKWQPCMFQTLLY